MNNLMAVDHESSHKEQANFISDHEDEEDYRDVVEGMTSLSSLSLKKRLENAN